MKPHRYLIFLGETSLCENIPQKRRKHWVKFRKNMDIFWGTMEYDEVFLQHHASQRHVQDGGDVIPEVGVHLDFIFHRLVIHHLEELRHHWQTLQRAVWFYTVGPFCIQKKCNFFLILFQIFGSMLQFHFKKHLKLISM